MKEYEMRMTDEVNNYICRIHINGDEETEEKIPIRDHIAHIIDMFITDMHKVVFNDKYNEQDTEYLTDLYKKYLNGLLELSLISDEELSIIVRTCQCVVAEYIRYYIN